MVFLAREANRTGIVTNTLALSLNFMAIAINVHASIRLNFQRNPDMLATAGSVSSGVAGVILGCYFNRSRLKEAQDAESMASADLGDMYLAAQIAQSKLLEMQVEFDSLI